MIQLIRKYKSVILFILTFLGVYVVLSMIYGFYLRTAASETYYPEYITHQVAVQSEWLVNFLGYDASIEPYPDEASMKLNVENVFVARIVEGCNAISVIILFIAFVVAFFQGWRATLLFVLGGFSEFRIPFFCFGWARVGVFQKAPVPIGVHGSY